MGTDPDSTSRPATTETVTETVTEEVTEETTVRITATARPAAPPATRRPAPRRPTKRPAPAPRTDPHFGTCREANDAGYGPYRRGIDAEYAWYTDRDHDGVVCET